MKEKIETEMARHKENFLNHVITVVQMSSVKANPQGNNPFGEGIGHVLETVLEIGKSMGFQTKNMDGYMGYVQYGQGEDYVGVIGHLDVVEEGEGWSYPPFGGKIIEGKIYGRGVLDNKGPILSCLYGLYTLKTLGVSLKKPIRILFGTDEESGFEDVTYYLKKEKPPIYGFTPDCKYPVVYGERGRGKFRLTPKDKSKQGMEDFFSVLNFYFLSLGEEKKRLGIQVSDKVFGEMELSGYRFMQTTSIGFEFVLKYPSVLSFEEILDRLKEKVQEKSELTVIQNDHPVLFEKDCFLVKTLQKAYETVTGLDGTPVTTTGGTYAKRMPNIVPFGPSFPGQKGIGHQPNEWMSIEDLMKNATIYGLAMYYLAQ